MIEPWDDVRTYVCVCVCVRARAPVRVYISLADLISCGEGREALSGGVVSPVCRQVEAKTFAYFCPFAFLMLPQPSLLSPSPPVKRLRETIGKR